MMASDRQAPANERRAWSAAAQPRLLCALRSDAATLPDQGVDHVVVKIDAHVDGNSQIVASVHAAVVVPRERRAPVFDRR